MYVSQVYFQIAEDARGKEKGRATRPVFQNSRCASLLPLSPRSLIQRRCEGQALKILCVTIRFCSIFCYNEASTRLSTSLLFCGGVA
jgi:hypothetical protein